MSTWDRHVSFNCLYCCSVTPGSSVAQTVQRAKAVQKILETRRGEHSQQEDEGKQVSNGISQAPIEQTEERQALNGIHKAGIEEPEDRQPLNEISQPPFAQPEDSQLLNEMPQAPFAQPEDQTCLLTSATFQLSIIWVIVIFTASISDIEQKKRLRFQDEMDRFQEEDPGSAAAGTVVPFYSPAKKMVEKCFTNVMNMFNIFL